MRRNSEKFYTFLGKITAFIWSATIMGASVNNLRTPLYREMVNIIAGYDVTFEAYKFNYDELKSGIQKYKFSGRTKITRSMLAWWAMQDNQQSVLPLTANLETEHISKKGRTINPAVYEMLGNKSLLEGKIKSAASAFGFTEKKNTIMDQHRSRKSLQRFMNCLYSPELKAASTSRTSTNATRKSLRAS